ncbi:type VII secretion protein EccE [Nocardia flavorosea]|uniref:type VII secretion protein EccE n=1 Tax=Nocardia flavorosea TaxID=53429 RepID=UPI0007A4E08A|nr:type VII secretion protein EccE [Nocardia flavorosea]
MNVPDQRVAGVERGPFACAVVGGSVVGVGLTPQAPLWVGAVVFGFVILSVTVRIRGRTPVRWGLDWVAFRRGRTRQISALVGLPPIREVRVPAGVCGIQEDGDVMVAMIQLAPNLDLPTVIAEQTVYTEDTVGPAALLPMLDQYGIVVDIDIVTTGQRVRSAGSYSMLYDQLIGPNPVVGNRLTWLVVRLDQQRNLAALAKRGPCSVVAPKALATAAHRIAGRLRERGVAAHALPADALADAFGALHAGIELDNIREAWHCVPTAVPGRFVTSFGIDWNRLEEVTLDDCWTWSNGRTTLVVSLSGLHHGPRAVVRYVGPAMEDVLPDYLRRLPGQQLAAFRATLPTGTSVRDLTRDERAVSSALEEIAGRLSVPIGPNGQILGAISGQPRHRLAMPLFDPARYNPRRRSVDVHADLPVAQQIILRATVTGADIEVHTSRPQRWQHLVSAVGDPRSLWLAGESGGDERTSSTDATIAVFDQVPVQGTAAPTAVSINDPGGRRSRSADLAIEQVGESTLDVSIPMRTVRVDLIEPRGETRYLEFVEPGRQVAPPPASAGVTTPLSRPIGRRAQ